MTPTYMIRIKPKVAAIKGNTPALRKITEATITPLLEELSEIITNIPAVIRTASELCQRYQMRT